MSEFDHDRLNEDDSSEVYPYGFWTWDVSNGRRGGMVCFRGECERDEAGKFHAYIINEWMTYFFKKSGRIDGLVIQMYEFFGDWHDDLVFVPTGIVLPGTFRAIYTVLDFQLTRAEELWGADQVRTDDAVALPEMDSYLSNLAPVQ